MMLRKDITLTQFGYQKRRRETHTDLPLHQLDQTIQVNNIILHPTADLRTLEEGNDMNDNCLDAMMQIIAAKHNNTFAVHSGFSTRLKALGWHDAKSLIPEHHRNKTLLIPIHTGGDDVVQRHWSLLVRQPNSTATGTEAYNLYYYDSLNDPTRAAAIQNLTNGNLFVLGRDRWHNIHCSSQIGRTCGAATAINAAIALERPGDRGRSMQEALDHIPDRDILTRAWVKACLQHKSAISLQWIYEEMESQQSDANPLTPSTMTPAPKRRQHNNDYDSSMPTTPMAPKPTRLEFTLPMNSDSKKKNTNNTAKRSERAYKTPSKIINNAKRIIKGDNQTPAQIKDLKRDLYSQQKPKQHKPAGKTNKIPPKKVSKQAKVKKRKGKVNKKHLQEQFQRYK